MTAAPTVAEPPKRKEPVSEKPATISLTAADLRRDWMKYHGKQIEVTGAIAHMFGILKEDAVVELDAGKDQLVTCFVADTDPWRKCVMGQTVKVRGKVGDFHLKDSVVVEAGEIPIPRLSAEQFAKQFAKNPEELAEKYKQKWFLLTGEIIDIVMDTKPHPTLILKGDGKLKLKVSYQFQKEEPLKVGQKVEIQADFMKIDDEWLRFYTGLVMGVVK
jgi:hypothetical protein